MNNQQTKTMRNNNNRNLSALDGRYDETSFWKKLHERARDMGAALVYKALQLYYAMIDRDTPLQAKLVIAGALAYLVCPVDLIPDFLPGGYADDMSAVLAALKTAEAYVTPKVMERARKKTADLFGVEIFGKSGEAEKTATED